MQDISLEHNERHSESNQADIVTQYITLEHNDHHSESNQADIVMQDISLEHNERHSESNQAAGKLQGIRDNPGVPSSPVPAMFSPEKQDKILGKVKWLYEQDTISDKIWLQQLKLYLCFFEMKFTCY